MASRNEQQGGMSNRERFKSFIYPITRNDKFVLVADRQAQDSFDYQSADTDALRNQK